MRNKSILTSLKTGQSKIKALADLESGESLLLLVPRTAVFSLGLHIVEGTRDLSVGVSFIKTFVPFKFPLSLPDHLTQAPRSKYHHIGD